MTLAGHCLCGAVTFSFSEPVNWVLHCHCESCRRATASPMTTFLSIADERLKWSGAPPATYASSPGVTRGFCATCGSPLFYRNAKQPDETHLYAALLTDPHAVSPEGHDFLEERIAWMQPVPNTKARA